MLVTLLISVCFHPATHAKRSVSHPIASYFSQVPKPRPTPSHSHTRLARMPPTEPIPRYLALVTRPLLSCPEVSHPSAHPHSRDNVHCQTPMPLTMNIPRYQTARPRPPSPPSRWLFAITFIVSADRQHRPLSARVQTAPPLVSCPMRVVRCSGRRLRVFVSFLYQPETNEIAYLWVNTEKRYENGISKRGTPF